MELPLTYEMLVLADDVADIVASAGGWLCDRVFAGWRVTAVIPDGSNRRPLDILGVKTLSFDAADEIAHYASPRALAVGSTVMATDELARRDVETALNGRGVEVTFWGQSYPNHDDHCTRVMHHRLSDLARAFKTQALAAAFSSQIAVAPIEVFRSRLPRVVVEEPDLVSMDDVLTSVSSLHGSPRRESGFGAKRRF
jgi:hypothetical protein